MSPLTPSQAVLGGEDNSVAPSYSRAFDATPNLAAALIVGLDRAMATSPTDGFVDRAFRQGIRRAAIEISEELSVCDGLLLLAWVKGQRVADEERDGSSPKDPTSRTEGVSK